jgi:hypothetical protein
MRGTHFQLCAVFEARLTAGGIEIRSPGAPV